MIDYKLTINTDDNNSTYVWSANKSYLGRLLYETCIEDMVVVGEKAIISKHITSFEISKIKYLDEKYDDKIPSIEIEYKDNDLLKIIKEFVDTYKKIKEEEKNNVSEIQEL